MFSSWQLTLISLAYIGLLFVIAHLGDKYRHQISARVRPFIYALTLGVYCTSWSFLGTTGQATSNFLSHLPIYLGPIFLFLFAWPFLQRIVRVSWKLNLTSIADLLAARFGKSSKLAVVVTLVALIGTLPYIALQLKAIVYSFDQVQVDSPIDAGAFGFIVSIVLAFFTMVFGIRNIDVTERHPGMMLAIAFESLIKLFAFLAVGIFVCFFLFDSPVSLWQQTNMSPQLNEQLTTPNLTGFLAMVVIVMAAFLSLPRQFQVMIVELQDKNDSHLSRKIFPIYLAIFAVLAIPLGFAGKHLLGSSVPSDAYVLFIPAIEQQAWLTLLAFIGAISAASSMVIISAIALSTMLSNEIVFPVLFRSANQTLDYEQFKKRMLVIRKALVLFVILLGYGVFVFSPPDTLSSLGIIAFGAIAQLTPALIAAFYWRKASLTGVYGGIIIGFTLWLTLNFMPQLGLYPQPFTDGFLPAKTLATLLSLSANILLLWSLSSISRLSVQERVQASQFLEWKSPEPLTSEKRKAINVNELELLVSRFLGEEKAKQGFSDFHEQHDKQSYSATDYNQSLLHYAEELLAGVMGASSARLVLSSAIEGRDVDLDELAMLVEDTSSQQQQVTQGILQSAIENASEGISIIDNNLELVAWNSTYLSLFNYPKALIYVGCPVEKLIRYNAERGLCGPGDVDEQVQKRLDYLKAGSGHSSERIQPTGQIIRIQGNPLPDGGFVMMFSDITRYRATEIALKAENIDLESLVKERTDKLEFTNRQLATAREKAEEAHFKKSLYLKACSHDLMQPLEAARLFTSALENQSGLSDEHLRQVKNIENSLKVAGDLLADLGEIARIESGNIKPNCQPFSLHELFEQLAKEFSATAKQDGVTLEIMPTNLWVYSDRQLLRRILQNLIGNAIRYASPGRVLLGIRRDKDKVKIQVVDNGPGIPTEKQEVVFEQFTQLEGQVEKSAKGLGLGLNITQGLCQILGHQLSLSSVENQGSTFSITVPTVEATRKEITLAPTKKVGLAGSKILCIDNDADVLSGLVELLTTWQCEVMSADSPMSAKAVFTKHLQDVDVLLVDYQLDNGASGLELIAELRAMARFAVPAILITATTEPDIAQRAEAANVGYMRKPVKPASLRALISATITKGLTGKFIS